MSLALDNMFCLHSSVENIHCEVALILKMGDWAFSWSNVLSNIRNLGIQTEGYLGSA